MEQKKYNGFASEEQYEAVLDIVMDEIDEYTETVMVEHEENPVEEYVVVTVETINTHHILKYYVNKKGVFYVNCEGPNFPSTECKILVALNDCALEIAYWFNKGIVGYIPDEDFGRVDFIYHREYNSITANVLSIFDVPKDFKVEDIIRAWYIFKAHYDGSCVGVNYEQIADMENLYESY